MKDFHKEAMNVKTSFMRSKYVEAAKTIILRDGVQSVTVRGIGEITGYSYPMIYHYFRDLNELLLETKLTMIGEMTPDRDMQPIQAKDPVELKKQQARQMIGFFIDNPNIFTFFFQHKLDESNIEKMRGLNLEALYYGDFEPLVRRGAIRQDDIPPIARAITFLVFGAVTLYMSGNGLTKEEAMETVDSAVGLLLKG